ncbi:MAG: peptide deformylase [Candidatus Parcubacteria bacterium]|nr:MAG: peptide deformylase [Candidatus Parcubacteria bacterium]
MNLIYYPNKILKIKTKKVEAFDKNLSNIIKEMKELMVKNNGVGLAANQVDLDLSLFIAKPKDKFYIFINPEIMLAEEEEIKEEGCLSIPNKWGLVKRYKKIKIQYQDIKGKKRTLKASGLLAHIIQHEIDHLSGILFIDKAIEIYNLKND